MACLGDALPKQWWRSKDKIDGRYPIEIEYAAHGSLAQAAKAHGVVSSTVLTGWNLLPLPTLPRGTKAQQVELLAGAEVSELERYRQRNSELERIVRVQRTIRNLEAMRRPPR